MDLDAALYHYFNFPSFRPGQEEALRQVLAGKDMLVVMPTGSGKSLIYQLAGLLLPHLTLVISPLVALMKDQVDSLTRRNIPATFINSSLDPAEQSSRLRAMANGQHKIVLVAPERLRSRAFRDALAQSPVSLLTVDEAHCLSQWGHDFRPDYLHIAGVRGAINAPVTLALTATATPHVQDDIVRMLGLPAAERLVTGFNRPNLSLEVFSTPDVKDKLNVLQDFLGDTDGAGIIYVGTRRDAEEVAEFAREMAGMRADYYHGALDPATRVRVQDAFMAGDLPVVVATNAFGMGIDRPDVRWVLHYTMPSTLEAYYQEAGRAGRDGLPARVVLFYSPKDRSLHEFFIENDSPSSAELRAVYGLLQRLAQKTRVATSLRAVENTLGLPEIKVRVALEQLEVAGALRRKPDGVLGYMDAEVQPLSDARLNEVVAQVSARHAHKRKLLDLMIGYAESGDCRRRLLLNYFGDPSAADAPICCDNCLARAEARAETQTAQTQSERAALIVLDTIQHMQWEIGAQKLAHILKGSKAKDVRSYAKARNFGKFSALSLQEIDDLLKQLISAGYAKQVGGDRPVLRLTPRGVEALKARSAIQVNLRPVRSGEIRKRIALQEAGGTVALTGQLLAQGKTPEQIAAERGLTVGTIFSHLAQLIAQGTVNVNQVVPADLQAQIRKAIEAVGSTEYLTPIKMRLPDVIEYSVIRCVVEAWKREHGMVAEQTASGQSRAERVHALGESGSLEHVEELIAALKDSNGNVRRLAASALGKLGARDAVEPLLDLVANDNYPQVKQYAIKALGRIGDMRAIPVLERIAGDKDERDYNRTAAITALRNLGVKASNYADHLIPGVQTAAHPNSSQISQLTNQQTNQFSIDPIADFLSRPHPRPLKGPWLAGWALDFHSRFDGDVNRRGAIGDLVFRYKYQEESALASELAAHWARLLAAHPELPKPDAIISIPPSAPRPFDPVSKLAEALAELLHIPAMTSALAKTRVTKPQKEMTSLAQKQVNVAGAFTLKESVRGKRVIVVDDLYDSGATLEEAARVLSRGGAAGIVVLTLTKTIHADA